MTPKDIAIAFLRAFWAADEPAWAAWLAPDAVFRFAPSLPYSLQSGREWNARVALKRIVVDMFSAFSPETGLQVELTGAIAEGGEVAVEYTARGLTVNGQRYENDYLMRATVENGLITRLVPYNDTRQLEKLLDLD